MSAHPRQFEQFIRRLRRRLLILRLLERVGLGVLFASAAAIPLLLIALWRGPSALPLASAALVVGALVGLLWGILTRPGELEAAMEADRQLDWADLLASALSVARHGDDPWALAVASVADARCRQTSPRSIILYRLGARAWGGIGLAAALVMALGFFPTYSAPAPAQSRSSLSSADTFLNPRPHEPVGRPLPGTARRAAVQGEPEDLRNGSFGDEPGNTSQSKSSKSSDRNNGHSQSQSVANSDTQGAGSGHTDLENAGELPTARQATGDLPPTDSGTSASGGGKSDSSAQGQDTSTGIASAGPTSASLPPWRSPDWSRNVKRAHDALDSGQVPDAYRDVVRAYFDRQ